MVAKIHWDRLQQYGIEILGHFGSKNLTKNPQYLQRF